MDSSTEASIEKSGEQTPQTPEQSIQNDLGDGAKLEANDITGGVEDEADMSASPREIHGVLVSFPEVQCDPAKLLTSIEVVSSRYCHSVEYIPILPG